MKVRYEVRVGKWGAYHYDKKTAEDLTLNCVNKILNKYDNLQAENERLKELAVDLLIRAKTHTKDEAEKAISKAFKSKE